jgi:hypothetical protein
MPLRLFVNELSYPIAECGVNEAAARLESLVAAFRAAKSIDQGVRIDSNIPLSQLGLASNWPLAILRNQPRCKELGLYLQRLQDRAPFSHAIAEIPKDDAGGSEYRLPAGAPVAAGALSLGLGLAHQFDGVAISLATHLCWSQSLIELEHGTMDEHGTINVAKVTARNAVDAAGFNFHVAYFLPLLRPVVQTGSNIWARRAELFPHLRFIPRVEGLLADLKHGDPLVDVVLDRLLKLDVAIGLWRETGVEFPPYSYWIRRESSNREKHVVFPNENAANEVYSHHGDYGPGENRYHFLLEETPVRACVVGHVGRKLGI